MSIFDNKDGFKPRDSSISTKVKYASEVEHYMTSISSREINNKSVSMVEVSGVIGTVLTLLISLIVLSVTSLIDLVKWLKTSKYGN